MSTSAGHGHGYLPAMGRDWLLPLYDPITRLLGVRSRHRTLVDQAGIEPGHRVLEIGCGTGNLAMLAQLRNPLADVVGLDPDPRALARARRKADRAGLSMRYDRGTAGELSYPDASVDRVLSALMFHHLDDDEKRRALSEARRVLRPGGRLHLVDFGGNHGHGPLARLVRRHPRAEANAGDAIPTRLRAAGFVDVAEITVRSGTAFYRATRS